MAATSLLKSVQPIKKRPSAISFSFQPAARPNCSRKFHAAMVVVGQVFGARAFGVVFGLDEAGIMEQGGDQAEGDFVVGEGLPMQRRAVNEASHCQEDVGDVVEVVVGGVASLVAGETAVVKGNGRFPSMRNRFQRKIRRDER